MGGRGGWIGVGMGIGVWGKSHAHMHAKHAHTCMLHMINMINMDASMSVAICNFYTCIQVHACMCHVRFLCTAILRKETVW